MIPLYFYVAGRPQTAGSPDAIPFQRKDGSLGVRVVEGGGNKYLKARKRSWRSDLRDAAQEAMRDDWSASRDVPLEVRFVVVRKRPVTHLRTGQHAGEVKDWAKALLPTTAPDLLKIARSAEDALTGVLWADDAQIVIERLEKAYGDQVGRSVDAEGLGVMVKQAVLCSAPVPESQESR